MLFRVDLTGHLAARVQAAYASVSGAVVDRLRAGLLWRGSGVISLVWTPRTQAALDCSLGAGSVRSRSRPPDRRCSCPVWRKAPLPNGGGSAGLRLSVKYSYSRYNLRLPECGIRLDHSGSFKPLNEGRLP